MTDRIKALPRPEKTRLRIGHMRLSDSAPLLLAQHHGLFEHYGLDVELERDVSWANLRDKLLAGGFDAAQMLSPLVAMSAVSGVGPGGQLLTGLVLSRNGNAVTLSSSLSSILDDGSPRDTAGTARALAVAVSELGRPLVLAVVHPFSMHHLQLRQWLAAGGMDLQCDLQLLVLPPEQMCEYLARGAIDGFCAGEPWTSVAVARGIGFCAAIACDLWERAPEKVLAVTPDWHQAHPATHLRLRLALMEACDMLLDPAQRAAAAKILSACLDLPESVLLPGLSGEFRFRESRVPERVDDFFVFATDHAGEPVPGQAVRLIESCCKFTRADVADDDFARVAASCFRTDLYREAIAWRPC